MSLGNRLSPAPVPLLPSGQSLALRATLTLLLCGVMLDTIAMERELDAVMQRFVDRTVALVLEHLARAKPAPAARKIASRTPSSSKPKRQVRSTSTPMYRAPLVPVVSEQIAPPPKPKRQGPSPERILAGVVKMIMPSPTGFTLEQLCSTLRVAPEALTPLLDTLVQEQKVRVVVEGTSTVYRRPRIEPIRRRRADAVV